jgi:hypothetical protein
VYLRPVGGRTRAVGIVKGPRLKVPPLARGELCYTPIEKILETLNATLPRGGSPRCRPRAHRGVSSKIEIT